MKKLAVGLLFLAGLSGIAGAACTGPLCWDGNSSGTLDGVIFNNTGPVVASSGTITAKVPRIGDLAVCNGCANNSQSTYQLCVATAATTSGFVLVNISTAPCK